MRVITNEVLYKRNARVALAGNLLGMLLLVASIYVLFLAPEDFGRYVLFLIGGGIFTQVGLYFNRWNKRPDRALGRSLKSLDNSFTLYNYTSPASHLLTGPSGLWLLLPRHTRGTITYDPKRRKWIASNVKLSQRLGQESIGNPLQEATIEAEALDRWLAKYWKGKPVQVSAALVFVDEKTDVEVATAPLPTASIKKLKQIILKPQGEKGAIPLETVRQLNYLFENAPQRKR
jgi:hypothetical protein